MSLAERFTELGLTLPPVAAPVAAYVPAVRHGDLVYTSGQLPLVAGALPESGAVGDGGVPAGRAAELARTCALNGLAAAADAVGGLEELTGVVKVVGYVASAPGFTGQPAVVDGASRLLGEIFGERGAHARSAVGVAALPLGAPVEVELVLTTR